MVTSLREGKQFKPVKLCLKIDLVPHPASELWLHVCVGGD